MSAKSAFSLPPIESRFGTTSKSSSSLAIAAERWNVEKKRIELDANIERFYDQQVARCLEIDKVANEKITKLYNDIYYKVKWSNPPLPSVQQSLFTNYCKHLITVGPTTQFPGAVDLKVWRKKLSSGIHGKAVDDISNMCKKLRDLVERRDTDLTNTQALLLTTTEKQNVKKDGTLRWMMEKNVSKRDEYFTVWYLASHGKIRELDVLLSAKSKGVHIDDRDPDFGLTALHYAVKTNQYAMYKYLMSKGADYNIRTPDGRTLLHLAAAYASREIVLELLGEGMDYDGVDNYGCTALQLAVQNKNLRTIQTLQNWTKLTLLPNELEELENKEKSLASATSTVNYTQFSNPNTRTSDVLGEESHASFGYNRGDGLPASPQQGWNLEYSAKFQPSTESIEPDLNIPEEYQPIPSDTIKSMSPALTLLSKRLNAYNMYLARNPTNYVPTEMLRSRDLNNMSALLKRSTLSMEEASVIQFKEGDFRGETGMSQTTVPEDVIGVRSPSIYSIAGAPLSLQLTASAVDNKCHLKNAIEDVEIQYSASQHSSHVSRITCGDKNVSTTISPEDMDKSMIDELKETQDIHEIQPHPEEELEINLEDASNVHVTSTANSNTATPVNDVVLDDHYFDTQINECMVEIRLCSKHYSLCVHENFINEAMRSLRRRWLVAKRLWSLVLLQKEHRDRLEEVQRVEQEQRMKDLLVDTSYALQYDEEGKALYLSADLLEHSVEPEPEREGLVPLENQLREKLGPLGEESDFAVNGSQPHTKYVRAAVPLSDKTYAPGTEADIVGLLNNHSPPKLDDGYNEERIDEGCLDEGGDDNDDSENDNGSETTASLGQPAISLERLVLAYDAMREKQRIEELNPDIENQSAETRKRPSDYDSLGVNVYKVKDNVYWETESGKLRMNELPLSIDTSSALSPPLNTRVETTFIETNEGIEKLLDSSGAALRPLSASLQDQPTAIQALLAGADSEKILSFIPNAAQETNAWEVIQKWHIVAEERRNQLPNIDIYSSANDECISTTSLLTYSVTEAPSTSAYSNRPDSPENASLTSQSFMTSLLQDQTFTAGGFKENARGTYIIKLGLDLFSVYLVRKEEGDALRIIDECFRIDNEVDATQKLSLLEKKIDLLIHVHDKLQNTIGDIETSLENAKKRNYSHPQLALNVPMTRALPSVRTIMNERILGMVKAIEMQYGEKDSTSLADDLFKFHGLASKNSQSPRKEVTTICSNSLHNAENQPQLDIQKVTLSEFSVNSGVKFMDPPVSSALETEVLQTESQKAIERLRVTQLTILSETALLSEASISLHREEYRAQLIEPASLAIAMVQRARVAERQLDGVAAIDFTSQAESVAVRALGGGSRLAISIMLETMRLFVKYRLTDARDLNVINKKATDINKYIIQFSVTDVKLADAFSQKCVEYLSISTVAIRLKEAELAKAAADAKLAAEREARRKLEEAQRRVGRKAKY